MQPIGWTDGAWVLALTLGLTVVFHATRRNTALLKDGKLPRAQQAAASTAKELDTSTKAKVQVTFSKLPLQAQPRADRRVGPFPLGFRVAAYDPTKWAGCTPYTRI